MTDPTITDVVKQLGDLKTGAGDLATAANIVWTLVTGFLVMFMQAGFALVETGLCRRKNAAHVMAMNFLVYTIGILGFWTVGFAFQMGGVGAMATFGGDPTLSSEFTITLAGKTFSTQDHLPVLVFPNPESAERYVVLNTGFTFCEYGRSSNALQIPKLPDYAVLEIADPQNVALAGFFDEQWKITDRSLSSPPVSQAAR